MKKLYALFLNACLYTVLITLFLCIFSALSEMNNATVSVGQFLLVLAFSVLLSAAGEILRLPGLSHLVARLLHYGAITVAFVALALLTGKLAPKGAHIVLAIVLFSLLYAAFVGTAYAIKKKGAAAQPSARKK